MAREPIIVVLRRYHDLDIHSPMFSVDEDIETRVIRNEIWTRYADRPSRANDRKAVHDLNCRRAGFGRAENGLNRHRTPALRRWIVEAPADQLACGFQPVLRETSLKWHDTRAFNSDLDVTPMLWIFSVSHPVVSDTGAPGKGNPTVNNQGFAMSAVIVAHDTVPADRVVPLYLTLTRFQRLQDLFSD